ncbi:hypothetical protein BJX68DRAFT_272373 [Aspergillus pseudodeflectus]|uniref:Uncharacterized protein n=1 Tax=Aspergillus pseudodeflectus TaxID=176178 RepID=A0ABR4JJ08_9EURO
MIMPHRIPSSPTPETETEYTLHLAIHPNRTPLSASWVLILRPHPPRPASCTWYSSFGGPAESNIAYHHRMEIKKDFEAHDHESLYFSTVQVLGTIQGKDLQTFENECFYAVDATQPQIFVVKVLYMMALRGLIEVHAVWRVWEGVEAGEADAEFDVLHENRYSRIDREFFAGFGCKVKEEAEKGFREIEAFRERMRRDAEAVLREMIDSLGITGE